MRPTGVESIDELHELLIRAKDGLVAANKCVEITKKWFCHRGAWFPIGGTLVYFFMTLLGGIYPSSR